MVDYETGPVPAAEAKALTRGEIELLVCLAAGHTNARIAALRSRSEKTVSNQLTSLYAKLRVINRAQAAAVAVKNGWVG
jgi:two-component system, NarL family, nitrate/nitrite response regulator NarL